MFTNTFQLQAKKCPWPQDACAYCLFNPPRLSAEDFEQLHFLPDPVPGTDGKYKDFSELYGTQTTDNHRPGLQNKPQLAENDKAHKELFVAGSEILVLTCCLWGMGHPLPI